MINKDSPLKEVLMLAAPCMCKSCSNGCKYGSGILVGEDSKNISGFLGVTEDELKRDYLEEVDMFSRKMLRPRLLRKKDSPHGRCVFYSDSKGCAIHEVKPLQCKTSIACKDYGEELSIWFMANHVLDLTDSGCAREFESYKKSGGKLIPGMEK